MKRIFYSVFVAALGTMMFSSCSNDDVVGADKTADYQANFEKVFGQLNPNQNFNTQKTVTIESSLANTKGNYTLRVYDDVPTRKGASLIGKFENLNAGSTSTLKVDVNKATKNIYCIADNGESHQVVTTPLTASNRVSAKFDATGAPTNEPTYNDDQVTAITVAFEDLGSTDDFDFNDAVIKVEYATGTGKANVTLMAVGAVLPLKLYYVGGREAEPLFDGQELHSVMGYDQSIMINTNWKGHDKVPFVTCEIEVPEDFTIGEDGAPFILEVDGEQGQRQITASTEYGAVPQVLVTGKYHSDEAKATYYWRWPKERVRLNVAYPGLSAWLADPTDLSFIAAGTTSKLYDGYDPTKEDEEEPEPPVVYEDLTLSETTIALYFDKEDESVAEVSVLSGNGAYTVESDNEDVASASIEEGVITVTAIAAGTAVITVTDTESGQTQTIEVEVSKFYDTPEGLEAVDLGLPSGTKWANMNVGANAPEEFGGYYAWGETEEKEEYTWATYLYWTDKNGNGRFDRNEDELDSNISGTDYDVAQVKWGPEWQMPTDDQIAELIDNCSYTYSQLNDVYGHLFTGPNEKNIFIPAAGYREENNVYDNGNMMCIWSGTKHGNPLWPGNAMDLELYKSNFSRGRNNLFYKGFSIRPVSK